MSTEDKNGFVLIEDNPISMAGVFDYLGSSISPDLEPDRVYKVWRPEEELNNQATIDSFKLSPWIPFHEMLGKSFTPAEEVGIQGVTGEKVYFKDGTLYSNLKLFGSNLKDAIKSGLKELSCGFACSWDIKSGVTPDGKSYDVVQRNIFGNHLASVQQGRMGKRVAVAMDKAVFALDSIDFKLKPNGEDMLTKEDLKVAMDAAIEPVQKALDEANKKIGELEKKAEDMDKGEKDEKTAEDMEGEKKKEAADKEKSEAMDAAIAKFESLEKEVKTLKSTAMDGNAVMKAFAETQNLKAQLGKFAGSIPADLVTKSDVSKYAVEKLGIACDSGGEVTAIQGFLAGREMPTFTVDRGNALDGAETPATSDSLSKAGL